jgi:tetratricopeptide (TPR) repeat protein
MKAEHRKELMTNSLAHRVSDAIHGIKEGPSRGAILVLVALGLILILVLAWRYFASSATESDSARWLKWDSLSSPEQLANFADNKEMQEHLQGRLARLEEARRSLHDGLRDLGGIGTRPQALENIKKAAERYSKLVEECADKPVLHQQVLMGAAKAYESLGDYEQAHTFYERLARDHANSVLGKEAIEQVKRLEAAKKDGDLEALHDEYNKKPAAP